MMVILYILIIEKKGYSGYKGPFQRKCSVNTTFSRNHSCNPFRFSVTLLKKRVTKGLQKQVKMSIWTMILCKTSKQLSK